MRTATTLVCACAIFAGSACSKSEPKRLAPEASALSSAAPITTMAKMFTIDPTTSGIEFAMDAELENISGRAPASAQGELFVDLKDLSKSNGLVKIDLDKLSIYKKTRDESDGEFGEEEKNEKQNADMRNWFQIGEDAPRDDRERYRWVEFKINEVKASPNDVTSLRGAKRKVTATVTGEFRLHGRVTQKTIVADLVFAFDGDQPTGITIHSAKPFDVGLEEHDVRPRKSFAELADKTLAALGRKVSKIAQVSVDATAIAK